MEIGSSTTNTISEMFGMVTSLPIDLLIIIVVFLVLFGVTTKYGKRNMMSVIISLYLAYALFIVFPYADRLSEIINEEILSPLMAGSIVFFVLFIIIYLIASRIICAEFTTRGARRWLEAGILSAVTTTLLLAFSYHILPIEEIYDFGEQIDILFASEQYFFWWLVVPFLGIFISVWGE